MRVILNLVTLLTLTEVFCGVSVTHAEPLAESQNMLGASIGLGSSQPYRPGNTTLASEVGARLELSSLTFSLVLHQEGGHMLRAEPSMSQLVLEGGWTSDRARQRDRYLNASGGIFFLLDQQARPGLVVDGASGWHRGAFDLGGYVRWESPWYPAWTESVGDALLNGLQIGGEASWRWHGLMARARAGIVGVQRPMGSLSVGAGWHF
jgi:hypothetical protein